MRSPFVLVLALGLALAGVAVWLVQGSISAKEAELAEARAGAMDRTQRTAAQDPVNRRIAHPPPRPSPACPAGARPIKRRAAPAERRGRGVARRARILGKG